MPRGACASFRSALPRHVGEEGQAARPLDRRGELALVLRAGAGDPPRHDLPALRREALQPARVLPVDRGFLDAELADLLLKKVLCRAAALVSAALALGLRDPSRSRLPAGSRLRAGTAGLSPWRPITLGRHPGADRPGSVTLGPVALGSVALGPVTLGPVTLRPVALGPIALGPVALGTLGCGGRSPRPAAAWIQGSSL